ILQIAPHLTTWAAIGLVVLMIGAAVTHTRRKEPLMIVPTLILATLAAVAAL
ncbi:MAG: DoxX-like family, partial [Acidimicrobiia bacterium]|nr:DoxX-like family [Acidimicrobiia bacterium]